MKKKLYILYIIIVGVLFIAGCGSSGGGESADQIDNNNDGKSGTALEFYNV